MQWIDVKSKLPRIAGAQLNERAEERARFSAYG
jgi:hypothetical protein